MTTQAVPVEGEVAEPVLEQHFLELAEQWHRETDFYSMSWQICDHPAYQEIIAMGEVALPWILRDLEDRGGQWFQALREITGQSPIAEADRGRIPKMTAAWLRWGEENLPKQ